MSSGLITVLFECTYCGLKWVSEYWQLPETLEVKCEHCGDSNIKAKRFEKVDYYGKT